MDRNERLDDLPRIEAPDAGDMTALMSAPVEDDVLDASDAEIYARLKARRAERRKKKIRRRAIIGGVTLAVLAAAVGFVALFSRTPEQEMEPITDMAWRGTFSTQVDARGTLEPLASTVVTPEVDGTIAEVHVAEGQAVQQGDVLFTIKNDELDGAVDEAARALEAAKEERTAAYSAYREAVGAGASKSEAAATAGTAAAERAVTSAQAAYDDAVAHAGKRTVYAPVSGSVVAMNALSGASIADLAAKGEPLVQIADLSQMKVRIQVDEESIARVAEDQAATITFPAFDELSLSGKVVGIASVASGGADGMYYDGSGGVTFAVDVLIPEPDTRLKPGMTAEVSLIIEQIDDVVMVPVGALQTDDGEQYYVNVEVDSERHAYERRDVEVVAKNDDLAVVGRPADSASEMVASPLEDGEVLVISGGVPADSGAGDGAGAEPVAMGSMDEGAANAVSADAAGGSVEVR